MKLQAQNLLPKFLDLMLDTVFVVDAQGNIVFVSASCERMFGYSRKEMIGVRMMGLVVPEDRERTLEEARKVMAGIPRVGFENRYIRKDGGLVHVMWSARWSQEDGLRIGVARDITERRRLEDRQAATYEVSEAAHRTQDLNALFQEVHQIVAQRVSVSAFAVSIFNPDSNDLAWAYQMNVPQSLSVGAAPSHGESGGAQSQADDALLAYCCQVMQTGEPLLLEQDTGTKVVSPVKKTDRGNCLVVPLRTQEAFVGALTIRSSEGVVYTDSDTDWLRFVAGQVATAIERQRMRIELLHFARYDDLTGLPNRRALHQHLQSALARCEQRQTSLAVMFIDINDFKVVNDTHGHAVGDSLLRELADHLKQSLREGDSIFRLGGDEFLVLLEDVRGWDDACFVANKLRLCIEQPITVNQMQLYCHASIGIAVYPDQGKDADTLLKRADQAMYENKKSHLSLSRQVGL